MGASKLRSQQEISNLDADKKWMFRQKYDLEHLEPSESDSDDGSEECWQSEIGMFPDAEKLAQSEFRASTAAPASRAGSP